MNAGRDVNHRRERATFGIRAGLCLAIGASLVSVVASSASAREPTREQVMEWARREVARAEHPLDLAGHVIRYSVTYPPSLSREELQALKGEIANHPEHPRRAEAEREERRLTLGPDVETCEVYIGEDAQWRWNRTGPFPTGLLFRDIVVSQDGDWMLSQRHMVIADHIASAPTGRNVVTEQGPLNRDIRLLRFGGFYADPAEFNPTEAIPNSGRWLIKLKSPSGHHLDALVRWDEATNRGFVEHAESWPTGSRSPSAVWDIKDWREASPGIFIASIIDERMPGSNVPARTLSFSGMDACGSAQFSQLIREPHIGGTDVARGPISPEAIADYRPGSAVALRRSSDGSWIRSRPPGLGPESAGLTLRWIGWGALGMVVVTLAALRFRRGLTTGGGTPA